MDLKTDKFIVLGSGLGLFWRKGADLFIDVAKKNLIDKGFTDFHFYWLGGFDEHDAHPKYGIWSESFKKNYR